MLAMFCFSVLAKSFFSAREAGLYTSASVLGKIIFFFLSAIYAVMFLMIAERHARGEDTGEVLKRSLAYTAQLSGSLVAIYFLFPSVVVLLFGSRYAEALPLVAPYGLATHLFSLCVILLNYHLAIRNFVGFTFTEIFLLLANAALLTASLAYTLRILNAKKQ